MDLRDALAYLDAHIDLEAQPSVAGRVEGLDLEPVRRLLHVLGDPQDQYRVIHVTGTNGKGSVARMIAELLVAHGLVVGLYSSPHLQRINERLWWSGDPAIRTDRDGGVVPASHGRPGGSIDDASLARVVGEVAAAEPIAGVTPSWFEAVTAAALTWFAELPVDVAVVEVGLLGRYDATNVVHADVAVVTNVGPDHTDFAPGWRQEVAREKAGIVKAGSVLVAGEADDEVRPIFEDAARGALGDPDAPLGALPLLVAGEDVVAEANRMAVGGRLVDVRTPGGSYPELFLPLHGAHQGDNAALAVAAVEAFFGRPLDEEVVRAGIGAVTVPGRCEVAGRRPLVLLDGAHNPAGALALAETLVDDFAVEGRRILVVGLLAGRDPGAMLDALDARDADVLVACTPDSPRALPAAELSRVAGSLGIPTETIDDVAGALERARELAGPDGAVVVTGSLYVVGAARDALGLAPP